MTWTATDDSGNQATGTTTVTVVDTTPPDLTVPEDASAEQTSRDGTAVNMGQASATDICDADVEITNDAPATFPLGKTTVTWTATDDSGNQSTDTTTVTVVDTTPPVLTVPGAVTAEQASADGTPVDTGEATATDICDADVAITNDAPAVFPLGDTTVTWTATDDSGNAATATQTVTVVDTTAPVLTVPADVSTEQTSRDGTAVNMGQASATDICDADVEITNDAPATFPLGETTVTWTATDDSGNVATGTQTVTVVDTTAPDLTIPDDVVVEQETAAGTVVELNPTATDICDADVTIEGGYPDVFPLGTTPVTFMAVDDSGNTSTGMMTVTVVDTTSPVLTVPGAVTAEQTSGDGTSVDIGQATAADICDTDVAITNDAPAVFPLGETIVTWTATDDSGNSATGTQKVTVVDTTPPDLTVPADASAEQTSCDGTPVDIGQATATDICDADVAITNDAPAVFPLGETVVTWTATDDSGNSATGTQKVTVVDTTPPDLTVPADASAEQTSRDGTPVDIGQATASDICDADVAITNDAPAVFPLGETTVTWTATDDSGNSTTSTQTVTVVDTTAPEIRSVAANPGELWPANHKMVDVTVSADLTDICDAEPTYEITGVECNEDANGTGDGNTDGDWEITSAHTLKLRAERSGHGSGRVYTIYIEATDKSGNASEGSCEVYVPHDHGNGNGGGNGKKGK